MTSPITSDAADYVWASHVYLDHPLPLNFRDWNQRQLEDYCLHNSWLRFNFTNGKEAFNAIAELAALKVSPNPQEALSS